MIYRKSKFKYAGDKRIHVFFKHELVLFVALYNKQAAIPNVEKLLNQCDFYEVYLGRTDRVDLFRQISDFDLVLLISPLYNVYLV